MERDFSMTGVYGPTMRVASTDTATAFPSAAIVDGDGNPSVSVLITCETASIRIAWKETPTQGASGIGHIMSDGDAFRVVGRDNILNFRYISAASGVPGAFVITPEF